MMCLEWKRTQFGFGIWIRFKITLHTTTNNCCASSAVHVGKSEGCGGGYWIPATTILRQNDMLFISEQQHEVVKSRCTTDRLG